MSQLASLFARYRKFVTAALAAAVVIVNETAGNGTLHWVDVIAAVVGALGVAAVPNAAAVSAPVEASRMSLITLLAILVIIVLVIMIVRSV